MKFELYIDAKDEYAVQFRDILEADEVVSKKLDPYIRRVDKVSLENDMDIIQRLVELGHKHHTGYRIELVSNFTKKELSSCKLYTIFGTKFISQDDMSINKMLDYSRELGKLSEAKPFGFRRLDYKKYYLKKAKTLKEESFAVCSGSGSQFFFGNYIADLMHNAGITGWSRCPVIHPVTQEKLEGLHLLGVSHELPEMIKDNKYLTTSEWGYSLDTLLMFEQRKLDNTELKDLNITQENLTGDGSGLCCVSKSFYDFYKKHNLKGLKFRPVLLKGSELYGLYIEKREYLESLFSGVPELVVTERY
ncbi:hypothetical protein [Kangiella aquimarina]|uniref:Uncharacterized protein n=1 Tax=Kangiella aquimarina TaxID=261965 RepID=A0ABZ0X284_9GAMM|nr:hypothetical protein [Kangiella aquimarina]WQG84489.1 hypothetical protein SR900_08425 [Kangiella aquimarina]